MYLCRRNEKRSARNRTRPVAAKVARMACGKHQRQDVLAHLGVYGRTAIGSRCLCVAWTHQPDCGIAHRTFCRRLLQLALSGLSRGRYLPDVALRPLCGSRQHLARHHTHPLRYLQQPLATEGTQHVVIGHRLCHHHRLWRFGGCRGSYRTDGFCHRFQSGAIV